MPKLAFTPENNGFAFINSWTLDDKEVQDVLALMDPALSHALESLQGSLFAKTPHLVEQIKVPLAGLIGSEQIVSAFRKPYGLCGGMAFAALDYFHADPREIPTVFRESPVTNELRTYLQQRQLGSLSLNLGIVLLWMTYLNVIPAWMSGGPGWLLKQSEDQWNTLKQEIDQHNAVPLALIRATTNPGENHQVLAYGYEPENSDGWRAIYIYDMNCPGHEQTIRVNFKNRILEESCEGPRRDLRGFFCETYRGDRPPGSNGSGSRAND